jgi:hypothetical protein
MMVDLGLEVFSKMKPDALRLQLQTVLITYQDAAYAVAAIAANANAAAANANANANAATPATLPDGGAPARHLQRAVRSLHRPPALGSRAARGWVQEVPEWVLARPKADAD